MITMNGSTRTALDAYIQEAIDAIAREEGAWKLSKGHASIEVGKALDALVQRGYKLGYRAGKRDILKMESWR